MDESSQTISHPIGPHSLVEGSVTPDEPSETMAFVIAVQALVNIAAGEDCSSKSLNTGIAIDLAP